MLKIAWAVAYGVVVGILVGGLLWLLSRQPDGPSIQLVPPPTLAPIQVHVAGAVNQPGLYALPAGSRAQDAILRAGGFAPDADENALNLAAFLQDGGRVYVPLKGTPAVEGSGETRFSGLQIIFPININLASQEELEALPEIGPETAKKILEYRQQHGAFQTLEEVMDVPGIGPMTYAAIKDLITLGDIP